MINTKILVNFFQRYKTTLTLTGVFLLALVFRLFLFRYRFAIGFDEPHYLQLALSGRLNGIKEILHPYWPPIFPIFIALFSFFIQNAELAGRLVSAVMGSALIVPIYYLTRTFFDNRIAFIAILLIALHPRLAFMNTSILVESTFMMLAISGVAVSWKALQKRSLWYALIAGFVWSLSYMTRPDGIGFLVIFTGFVIGKFLFDKTEERKTKLLLVWLVVMLSFVVTASPYLRYLHQQIGKWSLSLKWEVGKLDISKLDSLSSDNKWLPSDMAWHYGNYAKIYEITDFKTQVNVNHYLNIKEKIKNFYKVLNQSVPNLLSSLLFVLCMLGLIKVEYTPGRLWGTLYLLSIIIFFWFFVVPLFFVSERYLLPALPLCFIWVSKGVHLFWELLLRITRQFSMLKLMKRKEKYISTLIIAIVIFFFSYLPELGKVITQNRLSQEFFADAMELKKAGLWLKGYSQSVPKIMSFNKAVDFYAGVRDIRLGAAIPQNTFDRLLTYAHYRNVEYLVLTERYKERFPQVAFLLEKNEFPEDIELIYEEKDESGFLTRIFKLIK